MPPPQTPTPTIRAVRQTEALAQAMRRVESLPPPQIDAIVQNSVAETARPFVSPAPVQTSSAVRRHLIASPADLGRLVRERRLAMALTQQDLADAAGTGRRFVSELETGKATLEIGKVIHVCRYLGLDLHATAR